ncbi:ABC transporter substrate-binding protein [Nonlabens sp.]|uniref:ABC transporter substrate-binding protein n=1 Tax=Nonlabens sp. TaxID=1888209 RepID=UPI001BCFC3BB|nr:ABC transporter substrate-binding protein [Nonlabens sp.]
MTSLKIALDWTPNANHIGFFIAQELGFYTKEDVAVEIIDPSQDNYELTPAKKVELGQVDMALCPLESVMSYQTKSKAFDLIAIAALFQEDLSAIACKSGTGIKSPKDLDHTTYASYKARYEDEIVKQLIKNDGGKGIIECVYPDKLGIWETIEKDEVQATWIFTNWEAVQAAQKNTELTLFQLKDYGIPYSYSPVISCSEHIISTKELALKSFLRATKKGFFYTQEHPEKAAEILKVLVPEKDKNMDLQKSIELTCAVLGDQEHWGQMNADGIRDFLTWLQDHKLENHNLKATSLFTNTLLS